MKLEDLATTYLETLGYETSRRGRDLLIGHKVSLAGEREGIMVWIPAIEPGQPFSTQEGPYRSRFKKEAGEYPRAQKFMLVPTYEGLSKDFSSRAKDKYDVNIRVPIHFFDMPFKFEQSAEAKAAGSAALTLSKRGEDWAWLRVPQPYVVVQGDETEHGADILKVITRQIHKQSGSHLNLIIGPAGMGKTVSFEVLFSQLYSTFQKHKNQRRVFPRPLPLVPEYRRAPIVATAPTLRGLVEGFLRTEFAAPIGMETFQWMLVNGFGIWLIDGLDEVVERDPNFFNDMLEILTKPGSVEPMIFMWLRDSLLTMNPGIQEFIDEYRTETTIYELSRWGTPSKRAFAKIELGEQRAEPFMTELLTHKELNNLSSVPFYCKLISEEYKAGSLQEPYSETELLARAISNIIEREYDKRLFDAELLPQANLVELLQDLASEDAEQGFRGLTRETIEEYTEILLPKGLEQQTLDRLVTHMLQFAIFCQGTATGSVQFTQEIVEHFLLGECLYRTFCTSKDRFLCELSMRPVPADWVTLKAVASKAQSEGRVDMLLDLLQRSPMPDIAFRNVLQICAYAVKDPAKLKSVPFAGRDISGLRFSNFDFRGVVFRQCDLTDVEFDRCLLKNAKFEGAIVDRTVFFLKDRGDLRGAVFGDMQRFYSIRTQHGKAEMDYQAAKRWIRQRTGVVEKIEEPCDAALQLRYLFSKYIYPDGTPRRSIISRRGALAGKEYYDREKTLEAALRHDYLVATTRYRDRIVRCDGDMHNEMVAYVKDLTLSNGLRSLLDDLCPVQGCQHIPPRQDS